MMETFELAGSNPEFVPPFLDMGKFRDLMEEIDAMRHITVTFEQLLCLYSDLLLVAGDDAYKQSLIYYNSVRDASRRGIPGSQAVFRTLRPYFHRPRRVDGEPTVHEVERDAKTLLHGRKEGTVVITGKTAKRTRGKRMVVDKPDQNE